MKLFLSSYRAGRHADKLLDLISGTKTVAVITNAKDYKSIDERKIKVEECFDYFPSINLEPIEIDLRQHFHKQGAEDILSQYHFVWLAGGNVFLLRRALKYTGLDAWLQKAVRENKVILGGESAGAIIMGPTLRHSEMEATDEHDGNEDSAKYVAEGYNSEIIWEGLGLVDYVPVPHYKSGDYSAEIDEYIKRLDMAKLPHKEMTDEQAIIIIGGREDFLK